MKSLVVDVVVTFDKIEKNQGTTSINSVNIIS